MKQQDGTIMRQYKTAQCSLTDARPGSISKQAKHSSFIQEGKFKLKIAMTIENRIQGQEAF